MSPEAASSAKTVDAERGAPWRGFVGLGAGSAAGILALLLAFVWILDPYGLRAGGGWAPSPLMDINQRYMYPQLARSGAFDSAVFGTSTARLLDPDALGGGLGGRFANLAVNAGTPWEQMQLARLFLRHVPAPRTLILGLDAPWCDPDADAPSRLLTFRAFPPWLYDEDPWNDLPNLLSSKTLEIAGRVALNRLGLMPSRIRGDGYEVFTPPEGSYDLARARAHLRDLPAGLGDAPPASRLPAIDWLGELARDLPASTRLVVVLPPVHADAQPPAGSAAAAADRACKRRIAAAVGPRALVLDYRRRSALTAEDANFWDSLHYRLPIAARIAGDIARNAASPQVADDGRYELLSPGR